MIATLGKQVEANGRFHDRVHDRVHDCVHDQEAGR